MNKTELMEKIAAKGSDKEKIAAHAIRNPDCIPDLIEGLNASKAGIKYGCEKVLRLISEQKPELIYPYFETFERLLGSENSFLKWGAIITIANLTPVDSDDRFEGILQKYYAPVSGPVMITAANIIGSSAKIASAKPELIERITKEILKVEKGKFKNKGKLSPECKNVACGQAIDAFAQFFDEIQDREPVIRFVTKQLKNSRPAVRKKAEKFLKKHRINF